MIPQKRSPIVQIPVTFDSASKPQGLSNDKFYLSLLVFGVWIFCAIVLLISALTFSEKILYVILSFIIATTIIRYLLMRESYFKKKRLDLLEKEFQYPHSIFWNIYEVTASYPHICRYANGLKSVFVVFDKDVIVGQETDSDYYHYEAIADAYLQMHKRGIDCMHIDYMDTVGKDDRVNNLFNLANNAENSDLKEILTRVFDNVEYIMQHSYASYDVYCFYYNGKDELFMDELDVVLDAFLEANYIRYRILDKNEIGELVKSVFNIHEFSVKETSERLFTDLGGSHYITPIWIERDTSKGVEKKVLNPTKAQIQKEREIKEKEKAMVKGMNRIKAKDDYILEDDDDDLGGYSSNMNNPNMNNQGYFNSQYGYQGYNPNMNNGYPTQNQMNNSQNMGYPQHFDFSEEVNSVPDFSELNKQKGYESGMIWKNRDIEDIDLDEDEILE